MLIKSFLNLRFALVLLSIETFRTPFSTVVFTNCILSASAKTSTFLSLPWVKSTIKPEEMAAFGDNGNDLEMLRYVKYPFVMPNAEDFMKVRIDNLAVNDNNHNGVLDTIEALLAGAFDDNASKIFDK